MLAASAVTVPLRKIQYAGVGGTPRQGDNGMVWTAGAAFERGDLIAYVAAQGKWELADGDHDVAAATRLAVALSNPYSDAFSRPPRNHAGTPYGTRIGPSVEEFTYERLGNLRWILNVHSGTDFTEALKGAWYGLLWVAVAGAPSGGYMVVDLSDTTNQHFFVEGLAGREFGRPDLNVDTDQYNVLGNKQVRVSGYFASARVY